MLHVLLIQTLAKPIWDRRWLWMSYVGLWFVSWMVPADHVLMQSMIVLFALAVFVIPHQVGDLYLPAWILNPPWEFRWTYWATILGVGLATFLLTMWIWDQSHNFSIALFTPLIMWHWGSLDTIHIYPHRGPSWVVGSIGRGMLVFIAPLYFKPLETRELILEFLGTGQSPILNTLYSFSGYMLATAVALEIAAVVVHKFIRGRGIPRNIAAHGFESLIILLTFGLIHPLYGLTFYFLILHSLRHMYRVPAYIPEAREPVLDGERVLKNLSYHFQKTNFISFLAIFALAVWFTWKIFDGSSLGEATAACLQPLILLLVPHSLISLLVDFNPKRFEG